MVTISIISNCILAIMAIVAGVVSWFEYQSYKRKENNKLLSQLNRRYTGNDDIQTVVRYLREIEPDNAPPETLSDGIVFAIF